MEGHLPSTYLIANRGGESRTRIDLLAQSSWRTMPAETGDFLVPDDVDIDNWKRKRTEKSVEEEKLFREYMSISRPFAPYPTEQYQRCGLYSNQVTVGAAFELVHH